MAHLTQLQMVTLTPDNTDMAVICDIINLMQMRFTVNMEGNPNELSGMKSIMGFKEKYPELLLEVKHG